MVFGEDMDVALIDIAIVCMQPKVQSDSASGVNLNCVSIASLMIESCVSSSIIIKGCRFTFKLYINKRLISFAKAKEGGHKEVKMFSNTSPNIEIHSHFPPNSYFPWQFKI